MDWLNFRHLYSFWMVARARSFTGAAKEMHVAQSAVSAQVAALEDHLETPLLVRTNRSVELTGAGQQLLGYAHTIFAQSRAINTLFRDRERLNSRQTLRIGLAGGASRNFVFRLLEQYVVDFADIHLSVSTGSYSELYDLLKRFQLDSIISLDLPKKTDLQEVTYKKLGESKMCIVATPKIINNIRKKKLPKRMDVFKFRHPYEVDILTKYVQSKVKCELELRMDTDDIPLLRFFASSGKGIAVLPRVGVMQDLKTGAVEAIDLPRCPEVNIYGITTMQASTVLGTDGKGMDLWGEGA